MNVRWIPPVVLALAAVAPLAGAAATTPISALAATPSNYYGKPVEVSGTISHIANKVSNKGNPYVTFSLCSGPCVNVFAFGTPAIRNGQHVTVHGTFEGVHHTGGIYYKNVINADAGTL
ncbi:MAG: OB-fold protein [Vulcanimicrobiaceae bacterium]